MDTDEANQWALSVFVNHEILDENGDLLGVCGVGVEMEDLADKRMYADKEDYYRRSGKIRRKK